MTVRGRCPTPVSRGVSGVAFLCISRSGPEPTLALAYLLEQCQDVLWRVWTIARANLRGQGSSLGHCLENVGIDALMAHEK
jgi:hypothetical protein